MSPRYLLGCLERKEELTHREDLRFGLLASLLFNPNRKKGTRAKKPADWFGKPRRREGGMSNQEASHIIQYQWKPFWQAVARNRGETLRHKGQSQKWEADA